MARLFSRWLLGLTLLASLHIHSRAADDLTDYKTVETAITAKIGKAAPAAATTQASYLGVHTQADDQGRLMVALVEDESPAAKVGVKHGDVLVKLAGKSVKQPEDLREFLSARNPGDTVPLEILRGKKMVEVKATLTPPSRPLETPVKGTGPGGGGKGKGGGGNFDTRQSNAWRKDVYHLAVIMMDFPDVKHNDKVSTKNWEESLFSRDTYNKQSVTGQKVYGSMNDFYHEISYGTFRVEGKAFEPVVVSKKRLDYNATTGNKTALLTEAMDKLLERDGKEALSKFDGIYFMYAGGRVQTTRGALYWPHRASVSHGGKRWPYFICPEGGTNMANISTITHEFGHMLGLPDLYARPENPGSEGVGIWCTMSNQAGNGKPQHFSAWSKEQLDWIKPTVIDPTVPQKLILSPIYKSPKECYKVLVRPDASEYFLLENRNGKGFDASLPGKGMLIWRVVRNRPILEESHGVAGPSGPRVFLDAVPYPSKANDAFTPFTIPSSRGQLGGGMPVHITNIRRLDDGRITFMIGYEFF
jgi:M6 family metalloprotease-like protein